MRTKSIIALCIIIVLIIMMIIGCIYQRNETKRTIEIKERTIKRAIEETKRTVEIETDKGVDVQAVKPISLGVFKLTAYCSCSICCGIWANDRPTDEYGNEIVYGAIGEELKEGYSIAVDPDVIPYRTEVIINENTYKAQDCGGGIKGNEIDVYFEDHDKALEFGVQYSEVFVKNK